MTVFRDDLERGYRVAHCSCGRPSVWNPCRLCQHAQLVLAGLGEDTEEGTR